jgi:hypothetical protein
VPIVSECAFAKYRRTEKSKRVDGERKRDEEFTSCGIVQSVTCRTFKSFRIYIRIPDVCSKTIMFARENNTYKKVIGCSKRAAAVVYRFFVNPLGFFLFNFFFDDDNKRGT